MKNLSLYIKEAKKEDKSIYLNHKYKDDEVKSAIWDYVAGFTTSVNDDLRSGKEWKDVTDYLDKGFKDKKKLDLYRTVDWEYMSKMYKTTQKNIDSMIGKEFHNKGYMSTSSEFCSPWGNSWTKGELILHIVSDKQYPYIDVNKIFTPDEIDCPEQKEILLPRDTTLILQSYDIKKGKQFDKNGTYLLEMKVK